jgi:hypothetical protein
MRSRSGAWLLTGAAAIGFIIALVDYLFRGSGIDHTGGALLVTGSSLILTLLGLALARAAASGRALHRLLLVLSMVDILGTAVAAWFLHAWGLLAFMVLAFMGWVLLSFGSRGTVRVASGPRGATA